MAASSTMSAWKAALAAAIAARSCARVAARAASSPCGQPGQSVLVRPLRRQPGREGLQRLPYVEEVAYVGGREGGDQRAPVRHQQDEPVCRQEPQRLAQGDARDLQLRGQVAFHEPFPRLEFDLDDA